MPDETPEKTAPVDLEVLAERVRERLHAHGQHGALAEFSKYTAAVYERLTVNTGSTEKAFVSTPPASASTQPVNAAAKPRAKKTKAAK